VKTSVEYSWDGTGRSTPKNAKKNPLNSKSTHITFHIDRHGTESGHLGSAEVDMHLKI